MGVMRNIPSSIPPARIGSPLVSQSQEIVHAGLVELGQLPQNLRGDIHIPTLIVAVNALTAMEDLSQLSLG